VRKLRPGDYVVDAMGPTPAYERFRVRCYLSVTEPDIFFADQHTAEARAIALASDAKSRAFIRVGDVCTPLSVDRT
jgi:hypothetical protein